MGVEYALTFSRGTGMRSASLLSFSSRSSPRLDISILNNHLRRRTRRALTRFFSTSRPMALTLPRIPLFDQISKHDPTSTAIVHSDSGKSFTYGQLLRDVARSTKELKKDGAKDLKGERIAFLIENGYDYVGAHVVFPTQKANLKSLYNSSALLTAAIHNSHLPRLSRRASNCSTTST